MVKQDDVDDGASFGRDWDWDVTKPNSTGLNQGDTIASVRAEMEAAFEAARARVARRLKGRAGPGVTSKARARELLRQNRARVRALLGVEPTPPTGEVAEPDIIVADLHTLDRLLSYVRHSVVRVCFYNLKLFCPSLVDEYDDHVKAQVLLNLDQLEAVQCEIIEFFDAPLSDGKSVGALLPDARDRTLERMRRLAETAHRMRGKLDDEHARADLAAQVPALIDDVMAGLQEVQTCLDAHKVAVGELVEQALELAGPAAREAGLHLDSRLSAAPRVFADATHLLNCFAELVANAAKYSGANQLTVEVSALDKGGGWVEAIFADNGKGMTPDELASALSRGSSRGGTGEGLPMIVHVVEADHLGEFDLESKTGAGCRAAIRLPVKVDLRKETQEA